MFAVICFVNSLTLYLLSQVLNNLIKLSLKMNQLHKTIWNCRRCPAELPDYYLKLWSFFFLPTFYLMTPQSEWNDPQDGWLAGVDQDVSNSLLVSVFLFSQRAWAFRAVISHSRHWLGWPLTQSVLWKSFLCSSSVPVADALCLHLETSIILHCTSGLLISRCEYNDGAYLCCSVSVGKHVHIFLCLKWTRTIVYVGWLKGHWKVEGIGSEKENIKKYIQYRFIEQYNTST